MEHWHRLAREVVEMDLEMVRDSWAQGWSR